MGDGLRGSVAHRATETGTTTIQAVLSGQRSELLDHGVLYPEPSNHSDVLTSPMAKWERGRSVWIVNPVAHARRFERLWARFLASIQTHPGPVVISAEALSALSAEGVRRFFEVLPPGDVRAVLVDRPARRWLPSWHQQSVKLWSTPDFESHTRLMLASLFDAGVTGST